MKFFTFLYLLLFFSSCTTTRIIHFQTEVPAQHFISKDIKNVLLIDRTGESHKMGIIQNSILVGPLIQKKDMNKQIALHGLEKEMTKTKRYHIIRAYEILEGTGNEKDMNLTLEKDALIDLATRYNVDAVIALESYFTEFLITDDRNRLMSGKRATGIARIYCSFRMYSGTDGKTLDEKKIAHTMTWDSRNHSNFGDVNAPNFKNEQLKRVSFQGGGIYGRKISPSLIHASRKYYRGSNNVDFKAGSKFIEENNWRAAIAAHKKAISSSRNRSLKGYAAHNIAVIHEIIGDYDRAIQWANDAWMLFGNYSSRHYSNQLTLIVQSKSKNK